MEERHGEAHGNSTLGRALAFAALVAFVIANVIHNRFGVDVAVIPAVVFSALLLWRPRRWVLVVAAFFIAAPSLLFFRSAALTSPGSAIYFVNHFFLLLAALPGHCQCRDRLASSWSRISRPRQSLVVCPVEITTGPFRRNGLKSLV